MDYISKKILELQANLETNRRQEIKRIYKMYQDKTMELKDFKTLEKRFKFLFGKNEGMKNYENALKVTKKFSF